MPTGSSSKQSGNDRASSYDLDHMSNTGMSQPSRLLMDVFWVQWRFVTLPWQGVILGASWLTSLLVKFLTAAGAPPIGFKDKTKLQETQKIIEHLHQREDGFRRRLKELQAELESKHQDYRRVERNLAKVQTELVKKPVGRADSAELPITDSPRVSKTDVHVVFWVAGILPAYWLLQQHTAPSISRKFVWSLIAPEAIIYTFDLLGSKPPGVKTLIPAMSVFLSGFVFCHWLHAQC